MWIITMRCHFILTRMIIIKKMDNNKYWQDIYKVEPFHYCQGYKMVQSLWKMAWRFLQILKNRTIVYFHKFTSEMEQKNGNQSLEEISALSCSL